MNLFNSAAPDRGPGSAVGPEFAVEARVSELLAEWREQDEGNSVLPAEAQQAPASQAPRHRSGRKLLSVLRSLTSRRLPTSR